MQHELKIWPKFFARVVDGSKPFEVRRNDRDFQTGDFVLLREYDPAKVPMPAPPMPPTSFPAPSQPSAPPQSPYTGQDALVRITYVLHDAPNLSSDVVAFGFVVESSHLHTDDDVDTFNAEHPFRTKTKR